MINREMTSLEDSPGFCSCFHQKQQNVERASRSALRWGDRSPLDPVQRTFKVRANCYLNASYSHVDRLLVLALKGHYDPFYLWFLFSPRLNLILCPLAFSLAAEGLMSCYCRILNTRWGVCQHCPASVT